MVTEPRKTAEHMFSVELKSRENVKSIAFASHDEASVLIEGFLGELEDLCFTDGVMLEIRGTKGTLRMDLSKEELKRLLGK